MINYCFIFFIQAGELEIKVNHNNYTGQALNFTMLEFYGLQRIPNTFTVDGLLLDTTNIRSMNKVNDNYFVT